VWFALEKKEKDAGCRPVKLVSACLVGINCRFDGGNCACPKVLKIVNECNAVVACPELLAGFSVPRERMELRGGRVFTESGNDVTEQARRGAEELLSAAKKLGVKGAILKARSPSCGKGRIYDGSFSGKLVDGDGIVALLLMENGINVLTEDDIE